MRLLPVLGLGFGLALLPSCSGTKSDDAGSSGDGGAAADGGAASDGGSDDGGDGGASADGGSDDGGTADGGSDDGGGDGGSDTGTADGGSDDGGSGDGGSDTGTSDGGGSDTGGSDTGASTEPDQCDTSLSGRIGDPCTSDADCANTPGTPYCNTAWPDGYCMDGSGGYADNCDLSDPVNACGFTCLACGTYSYYPVGRCYVSCTTSADCRTGYACQLDGTGSVKVCLPSW